MQCSCQSPRAFGYLLTEKCIVDTTGLILRKSPAYFPRTALKLIGALPPGRGNSSRATIRSTKPRHSLERL